MERFRQDPRIRDAEDRGLERLQSGDTAFELQVIRGALTHLVASRRLAAAYTPHPVRARFLRSTLTDPGLAEIVARGQTRVLRATDPDSDLIELRSALPP